MNQAPQSEDTREAIKRLIEDILLHRPPEKAEEFVSEVQRECGQRDIEFDAAAVIEYWWHLVRLGVVAIPGYAITFFQGRKFPTLVLTERGRALLEHGEKSPHDPPRYLNAVRQRVQDPDNIALGYLDEAVGAWAAGLYRASAVMLGCACERLVLILAEQIARAGIQPWSDKVQKTLGGAPVGASRLFDLIRECLIHLAGDKRLPRALADALDRKLTPIFEHARGLRNKSGHPTGTDVSADEAEAGLLLFPGFYGFVDGLCKHLLAMGDHG
ncbi:MAG: hypothetical protein AMK72_11900 [Planctomycetes bacterium SM23_25]|nr:MAG: hypothetical protein AMS14_00620 [Planctomycetes bacterium DG_20]KPK44607.1 MAG: hypothetical protein AMK72_11900 [Planctomycetes bacterium SM23_25]